MDDQNPFLEFKDKLCQPAIMCSWLSSCPIRVSNDSIPTASADACSRHVLRMSDVLPSDILGGICS